VNCRFSKFVIDIGRFLQRQYRKIRVIFTVRKNLLQYEVYYVRL
jgi:hypothetical protein